LSRVGLRGLKARYTLATVKLALSNYGNAIRAVEPNRFVLHPRKMRSGQRFSYLALEPEETPKLNAAYYQRIHRDQSSLIPLDREVFIEKALELLASDRYLQKGMGLMALTRRYRPRSSLARLSASQKRNSPSPPHLRRPAQNPPSSRHQLSTTGPQLPKYVSAAFGSLDLFWKPGHLRSAYGAISTHRSAIGEMSQENTMWSQSLYNKIRSQGPFIRLAPHFTVLDIWSGFGTDRDSVLSNASSALWVKSPNGMSAIRPKLGPSFRTSTGARLMVIRFPYGQRKPLLQMAEVTRSMLF
jgi:hypothetical protein